jgi:hypothetical protein
MGGSGTLMFTTGRFGQRTAVRFPNGGTEQSHLGHLSMPSQGQGGLQADEAILISRWWLGFTIVPARCQSERGDSLTLQAHLVLETSLLLQAHLALEKTRT